MYRVDACVSCRSRDLERTAAVVAPFLTSYVLGQPVKGGVAERTDLCRCATCDLAFFDLRLEDDEITRLYAAYRSRSYYKARHKVEPFYTWKINEGIGGDDQTIAHRRQVVGRFLVDALGQGRLRSVLDYGGDAGQFLPEVEGAQGYVYEISEVQPVEGVTRLASMDELAEPVDLVVLAHVLEHASSPIAMLEELQGFVGAGGYVYVEVPLDRPKMPPRWARRGHERWVAHVSGSVRRTVAADTVSTPLRVLLRDRWMPGTFPKLHEHLNFFSEASLAAALSQAGWDRVASFTYAHGTGPLAVNALGMLGRSARDT
ncbi:MAG: Methyltransferase type 11 [Frankiales bacterium]|jgi:hypothetical protein|nr:Methyltransferase type 11 [Frankiales bacterium]